MRAVIFDRVEPPVPQGLPMQARQTCSQWAAGALFMAAIPVVMGLAIASMALIYEAMHIPAVRAVLAQHPAVGLEILAAIALWFYLLAVPLKRLFDRMTLARTVAIDERMVTVTEAGRLRARTWSAPLSSYVGLAHHLRTTLSGTRHELILVHPEIEKAVLISVGPSLTQSEVDRVAQMLGQTEILPHQRTAMALRPAKMAPCRPADNTRCEDVIYACPKNRLYPRPTFDCAALSMP